MARRSPACVLLEYTKGVTAHCALAPPGHDIGGEWLPPPVQAGPGLRTLHGPQAPPLTRVPAQCQQRGTEEVSPAHPQEHHGPDQEGHQGSSSLSGLRSIVPRLLPHTHTHTRKKSGSKGGGGGGGGGAWLNSSCARDVGVDFLCHIPAIHVYCDVTLGHICRPVSLPPPHLFFFPIFPAMCVCVWGGEPGN